jgi:hypothetical protein
MTPRTRFTYRVALADGLNLYSSWHWDTEKEARQAALRDAQAKGYGPEAITKTEIRRAG